MLKKILIQSVIYKTKSQSVVLAPFMIICFAYYIIKHSNEAVDDLEEADRFVYLLLGGRRLPND